MNTILLLITSIVLATADQAVENWGPQSAYEPATIVSQGPWVEETLWERDPKGMEENLPTPASIWDKFSSWWTWDR